MEDSSSSSAAAEAPTATEEVTEVEEERSALQDNIERKGKNAYYFAHAHKATGPKWDGKIEPKLLASNSNVSNVSSTASMSKLSLMAKSNITNYAFLDDGKKVKIYVNLPGVGECDTSNITIDFTERSLCLTVKDYIIPSPTATAVSKDDEEDSGELIVDSAPSPPEEETIKDIVEEEMRKEDRCLTFAKLYGDIEKVTFKKKADKVIVIITKKVDSKWDSIIA